MQNFKTISMTIEELKYLKESEDKVEFKEAKHNFSFAGSEHREQKERRKCLLGYIVCLANENGGNLILGMTDKSPRSVTGTDFADGKTGELIDETYARLGIRIEIEELTENEKRVLNIKVPSRPIGKLMKFEGISLMRTGESLHNMSDEEMFKILSEQEPDFSAKICSGLTIDDLDEDAINVLKEKYARKQNNEAFLMHNTEQILSDLKLRAPEGITYAALILLGNERALSNYLPNAQVNIEYRQSHTQIHFDKREPILKPLFLGIDEIWDNLNSRNRDNKIDEGPYKFDLPFFNEEVIREAVINAIAHRNYSITSETVIKQYPDRLTILNPGGFPKGVTTDNIITVSSTPRSRLLTEVLEKTGLVERSGQGVDKIFRITIAEGKLRPDYSKTDDFQVELTLNGEVQDNAFAAFISNEQGNRDTNNRLGTFEIIALYKVKEGQSINIDSEVLESLETANLILRVGGSASNSYVLGDAYYKLKSRNAQIAGFRVIDLKRVYKAFEKGENVKMADFTKAFEEDLSRARVKYLIDKLTGVVLDKSGSGSGTSYKLKKAASVFGDLLSIVSKG